MPIAFKQRGIAGSEQLDGQKRKEITEVAQKAVEKLNECCWDVKEIYVHTL